MESVIRMSHTMQLVIDNTKRTFLRPDPNVRSKRLTTGGYAMMTAINVFGTQFVTRGLGSNFVEQLTKAVKTLREASPHEARGGDVDRGGSRAGGAELPLL